MRSLSSCPRRARSSSATAPNRWGSPAPGWPIDYLQAHPGDPVSGTELARLSNVSLRALQDGFRRFAGMSIVAYQRRVRLEHAHDILARSGAPSVTDVALRLGFSNVGRFCQYFQQAYGVSPAALRKGLRL